VALRTPFQANQVEPIRTDRIPQAALAICVGLDRIIETPLCLHQNVELIADVPDGRIGVAVAVLRTPTPSLTSTPMSEDVLFE
jgi:hypothetical protein